MNRIIAAALTIASVTSASAAGPFQVRRATSGSAVNAAPPCATIVTSPYDGDVVSMMDGASYYYGVYDALGAPMQISVIRNVVTNTLRISFDDGNPASAPVSMSKSTVTVAPESIQDNDLEAAIITILPRDANGVLLGRGLSVSIDSSLLWPAHLTGAITDMGDGSYRASAVAPVIGTGTVRVTVEGVVLSPMRTITVIAGDPSQSLRDIAIEKLQSLIGPGGPLDTLGASAGANTPQAGAIADAIDRANRALQTLTNRDVSHDDNVLKTDFDAILGLLESVLSSPGALTSLDVRDAMDDLLDIARLIAQWHVDQASLACGVCDETEAHSKLCDAIDALAEGDAMRAAVSPDWGGIVDAYARAVQLALQSLQHC